MQPCNESVTDLACMHCAVQIMFGARILICVLLTVFTWVTYVAAEWPPMRHEYVFFVSGALAVYKLSERRPPLFVLAK